MAIPTRYLEQPVVTDQGVRYAVRGMTPGLVPLVLAAVIALCLATRSAWPVLLLMLLVSPAHSWYFLYNGPRVRHTVKCWGIRIYSAEFALTSGDSASSEEIPDSLFVMYRPRWQRLMLDLNGAGRSFTLLRSNDSEDVERCVGLLNGTIGNVLAKSAP